MWPTLGYSALILAVSLPAHAVKSATDNRFKVQPDSLRPADRVNYAIYRAQIEVLINRQKFREYEKPLNADTAFWSILTVTALKPFHTERDYTNYIAQLNDIPRYFQEQIANMRTGLKRGFTPPKVILIGRDASLSAVTNAKRPEDVILPRDGQSRRSSAIVKDLAQPYWGV